MTDMTNRTNRDVAGLSVAETRTVYDFAVNSRGTDATLLEGARALMPAEYYTLAVPPLIRR